MRNHITYPRADYDPITNTVWMIASESQVSLVVADPKPEVDNVLCGDRVLHIATTPLGISPTSLADCGLGPPTNCWRYLTGSNAVDVSDSSILQYVAVPGAHGPFEDSPTHLSVGFDERAVMVAAMDVVDCTVPLQPIGTSQCLLILERELTGAGGPSSYHEGTAPMPSEMTMVRLGDLDIADDARFMLAVQEPYDHEKMQPEFENLTLFISTDGTSAQGQPASLTELRLRGVYWDDVQGQWVVRQQLQIDDPLGPTYKLLDMDFDPAFSVFSVFDIVPNSPSTYLPIADTFQPLNDNEMFTSAVLAEDWLGNDRLFAVHAALARVGVDTRWVVQWYVIDPDIANFHDPNPIAWQPEILEVGRIVDDGASPEGNPGECYLPTIGVSRCGQVFIEYTYSNSSTQPEIRRATLNYAYDAVASTVLVQPGKPAGYQTWRDRWALYPDMQADPSSDRFWSSHTLGGDSATKRDAWLARRSFFCFQPDMNDDGVVDPIDLALYTDLYGQGHERADTNADAAVDVVDMLNYLHQYDAATGP